MIPKRLSGVFLQLGLAGALGLLLLSCGGAGLDGAGSGGGGSDSTASDADDTAESSAEVLSRTDVEGDFKALLPYEPGETFSVIQGYGGTFSHYEECYYYALDFDLPEETPIAAVADGRVIYLKEDSDVYGITLDYWDDSNYVMVDHGFGYYSLYVHLCLNCVDVEVGDTVSQGEIIARSGHTGYSTGPHLHFEMRSWETHCSVPYGFHDVPDDGGIAAVNSSYTSLNDGGSEIPYEPTEIAAERFSSNGVVLTQSPPWVLARGSSYDIAGTVTNGLRYVYVYLVNDQGVWQDGAWAEAGEGGAFTIAYTVSEELEPGAYYIIFSTSDTDSYSSTYSDYAWVE